VLLLAKMSENWVTRKMRRHKYLSDFCILLRSLPGFELGGTSQRRVDSLIKLLPPEFPILRRKCPKRSFRCLRCGPRFARILHSAFQFSIYNSNPAFCMNSSHTYNMATWFNAHFSVVTCRTPLYTHYIDEVTVISFCQPYS